MPRRYQIGDLATRCRQRTDKETDFVIGTQELKTLLSEAYGELYVITFECGSQYFEYAQQLTTTGAATVAEVSNHLSTVTLAYLADAASGRYIALRELMSQERVTWSQTGAVGTRAYGYAFVDDQIYLYPTPPAGQVYELRYVPQPPDLDTYADTDVVDVVTPDGLTFLIWAVAVKIIAKVQGDATLAIQEREAARMRFTESVRLRSQTALRHRILDIEAEDGGGWDW